MNKSAVLHIPLSQYAYASGETKLTVRIRTAKGDLTECSLYYADRACRQVPIEFQRVSMEKAYADEIYDYYEGIIDSPYTRVCYYFKLEKEEDWTYYYADEFRKDMADVRIEGDIIDGRSEYYQYPFILRSEILKEPDWFKNAVVYNIFPDSFATKSRFIKAQAKEIEGEDKKICRSKLQGSIRGILENLDYIENLGFNCLYLNPIFTAGESHKYDIRDYYSIDPCFGTNEEFKELVDTAHERDMHIIIDGVFNHCSWEFFAFDDVVKNGRNSKYWDWFYELEEPVIRPDSEEGQPNYACFAYERKMPKLNTAHNEVQEYFFKVCQYWMDEFHVDGWRLDVANEIDKDFWRMFRKTVKSCNEDAVLIGEVWENSRVWLRGDMFDSTMNYDFRRHCRDFFGLRKIDADTFVGRITAMYLRYPKEISEGQLNLLDSHDVPRFLSLCKGNRNRWKMAFCFLMLMPGVPSLFYGDEKELAGIKENEYRKAMPWNSTSELEALVKELSIFRKKYIRAEDSLKIYTRDEKLILERGKNVRAVFDIQKEKCEWKYRDIM